MTFPTLFSRYKVDFLNFPLISEHYWDTRLARPNSLDWLIFELNSERDHLVFGLTLCLCWLACLPMPTISSSSSTTSTPCPPLNCARKRKCKTRSSMTVLFWWLYSMRWQASRQYVVYTGDDFSRWYPHENNNIYLPSNAYILHVVEYIDRESERARRASVVLLLLPKTPHMFGQRSCWGVVQSDKLYSKDALLEQWPMDKRQRHLDDLLCLGGGWILYSAGLFVPPSIINATSKYLSFERVEKCT